MPKIKSEHKGLDKYQTSDGSIHYYKKGTFIYHNPYGPAVIYNDGFTYCYIEDCLMGNKKLESEYSDLDKYEYNNNIYYYKKDTCIIHNIYGPASIYEDGEEVYWINNEYLTKKQFEKHPERLKYLKKRNLICLL